MIGMVIEVNKRLEEMINALQSYVPIEYWNMFDWKTIVNRGEEVADNIYCFDVFLYKLYFNNEMIPVEYNNQHIMDNMVFLDLNEDSSQGAGTYDYIGDMPE